MKKVVSCTTLAVVSTLSYSGESHASGPGFSGLFAAANNAETVDANPAGMVRLADTQMTLQGALVQDFSRFKVDEDVTTVEGGNPDKPAPALAPSFYYSHQYNEDWWLGFSVTIPLGFGANNGRQWAGRYYSDEFSLVYVAVNPTVAYKVNDNLSLGAKLRIMYTDSKVLTQVNNDLTDRGLEDGKLEASASGVGFGYALSALYSFTDDTRVGLSYNSQVSTDLDTAVDFHNVRRPDAVIQRLQSQTIEVGSKVPAVVGAGVYHRLDNDWELTWDAIWVEFSKFGATSVHLDEETLEAPDGNFKNFFVSSVGVTWPISSRMRGAAGGFWMESPVDNADRSFAISVDEMMGVGGGYTYRLDDGNDYELELNVIDTGSAPIDTGPSIVKGRVAGESKDHYSLVLSLAYNWR
jgi:long-chain fatty acid transport protein